MDYAGDQSAPLDISVVGAGNSLSVGDTQFARISFVVWLFHWYRRNFFGNDGNPNLSFGTASPWADIRGHDIGARGGFSGAIIYRIQKTGGVSGDPSLVRGRHYLLHAPAR